MPAKGVELIAEVTGPLRSTIPAALYAWISTSLCVGIRPGLPFHTAKSLMTAAGKEPYPMRGISRRVGNPSDQVRGEPRERGRHQSSYHRRLNTRRIQTS